ncbi:MAG: hopanoid biosynthesis associated radical SAM protein HpnJ [Desulfuromonadia bacterium]
MKTLFLNPPAYEGFDGGAGARYVASREVTSFWYPTWLCFPAAMIPESRVVDAPVQGYGAADCARIARGFQLAVLFTSTPTLSLDITTARLMKEENPALRVIFVGPHVSVDPVGTLEAGRGAIDVVCRGEFDLSVAEIADGTPLSRVAGITFRDGDVIVSTPDRPPIADLDAIPFVSPVYARDLPVESYVIPHFLHPYVSIYTSRGCPSRCSYCLWPQTMTGRQVRSRSPENVIEEVWWIRRNLPQVREIAFDDDTFTADPLHARRIAGLMKGVGISWAANARVTTDYETLKAMREGGLRHLVVGFESGNDEILRRIRKGTTKERAIRFVRDCKSLGISIHGAFVMGLPGETRETIRETIEFARRLDIQSIQASIASPYPGTDFYDEAVRQGWFVESTYLDETGCQRSVISYPHLDAGEITSSVEEFYRRFYFRPRYIARTLLRMMTSSEDRRKFLQEGREYLRWLRSRKKARA